MVRASTARPDRTDFGLQNLKQITCPITAFMASAWRWLPAARKPIAFPGNSKATTATGISTVRTTKSPSTTCPPDITGCASAQPIRPASGVNGKLSRHRSARICTNPLGFRSFAATVCWGCCGLCYRAKPQTGTGRNPENQGTDTKHGFTPTSPRIPPSPRSSWAWRRNLKKWQWRFSFGTAFHCNCNGHRPHPPQRQNLRPHQPATDLSKTGRV